MTDQGRIRDLEKQVETMQSELDHWRAAAAA